MIDGNVVLVSIKIVDDNKFENLQPLFMDLNSFDSMA